MFEPCTANVNNSTRSAYSACDFSCAFFNTDAMTNAILVHIALAVCFFVVSVVVLPVSIISIIAVISVINVLNVIIIMNVIISLLLVVVLIICYKFIQKHTHIPATSKG